MTRASSVPHLRPRPHLRPHPRRGAPLALAGLVAVLIASATVAAGSAHAASGATAATASPAAAVPAVNPADPLTGGLPDLGPNVRVFTPSMSTAEIQAVVDAIAAQQVGNQFGLQRYALLFEPGTYGSASAPLNFEVGYYTSVAGLGASPTDVTINGSVFVHNQCEAGSCTALNNFWRSLSNLTINVTNPDAGCYAGEFWAVSQAAPMRRVNINGTTTLMDYCTAPSFASGGFIADSRFSAGPVINGSQQQWVVRNSAVDSWSNGVWNQVFSGVTGAPAQCFPADASCGGPYTTLATSPATREPAFLYEDADGLAGVFVPALRRDTTGTSWASGTVAGKSLPLSRFLVATPGTSVRTINNALARGSNLLLTPGVYSLEQTIKIKRAGTVVLGLGYATLIPQHGVVAISVADVPGVDITGLIIDAGPQNSPVLLRVGTRNAHLSHRNDPTALQDVFFRIGGAAAGKATVSLEVNADNVVLDDIWAWRADHGTGVGWSVNTADTGLVVNGDDVSAYGLFVEHYQKFEVIWNGNRGRVVFFQNEMPYDPPSQAAWMQSPGVNGWSAFKLAGSVRSFTGYGMGSYSFFNQGVDIEAAHAFEVPATLAPASLNDLLTIFLDPVNGRGGIQNVVNDTGGSSTAANADTPVTVVSYPGPPAASSRS